MHNLDSKKVKKVFVSEHNARTAAENYNNILITFETLAS